MNSQIVEQLRRLGARMPVALISSLCLALFGRPSRETAADVNGPASAEMRVGDFRQITGTGFSMAGAYAKKESGILDNIDLPQRQVTTKDLPAIP